MALEARSYLMSARRLVARSLRDPVGMKKSAMNEASASAYLRRAVSCGQRVWFLGFDAHFG